jgi:hypothetical protein
MLPKVAGLGCGVLLSMCMDPYMAREWRRVHDVVCMALQTRVVGCRVVSTTSSGYEGGRHQPREYPDQLDAGQCGRRPVQSLCIHPCPEVACGNSCFVKWHKMMPVQLLWSLCFDACITRCVVSVAGGTALA